MAVAQILSKLKTGTRGSSKVVVLVASAAVALAAVAAAAAVLLDLLLALVRMGPSSPTVTEAGVG